MTDRIVPVASATWMGLVAHPFLFRILLSFMLVLTTFVVNVTVEQIAALLPSTQADLFAPYRPLFPGASEAAMAAYPCQLYEQSAPAPYGIRKVMCILLPEEGVFQRVSVYSTNDVITGITFNLRHMRLVDLIWEWGKPDQVYSVNGQFKVEWKQQLNILAALERHYSVQAQVNMISITNALPTVYRLPDSYMCGSTYGDNAAKWGCNFPSASVWQ